MPLAVALSGCGGSGSSDTNAMLLPDRIDQWVRQDSPTTYDRETIFDYIDGAGEVYRSYAFEDVAVARYTRSGSPDVTVEVFDMGNADDAYGVFSYARESEEVGIGAGFERKGSVLCFWQDRFYVCVAAEISTDVQPDLEAVARGISNGLPQGGERPSLVAMLPADGMIPFSDRYFHTHQSLNYHYYLARDNVLRLGPESDVVLARYHPGSTYLVIARYRTETACATARSAFVEQYPPQADGAVPSEAWGRFLVLVLDAPTEADAQALVQAALTRIRDLAD